MEETLIERLPPIIDIGPERQLFLDDTLIDAMERVSRRVNQPDRHPQNPIFEAEHPWESGRILYSDVVFDQDEEIYKLWYSVYNAEIDKSSLCYAVSEDGIHFQRPELGLVEFDGSTSNNLLPVPDRFAHDKTVIKDSRDQNPERRYKMVYYTRDGVGVAWSADGLRWTPHDGNPVINPTGDASQSPFFDERLGLYVMFVRPNGRHMRRWWRKKGIPYDASVFPTRRIGRSVSIDFETWTHIEEAVEPDERDGDGTEFYYMPVLRYESGYIGFLNVYHELTGDPAVLDGFNNNLDAQLAFSRDGIKWSRVCDRQVFLGVVGGAWDERRIYVDEVLVRDDEILVYYRGSNIPHAGIQDLVGKEHNGRPLRGDALGLARLRLDGFVSVQAGAAEGSLTTRPLRCSGGELRVNADAAGGSLQVEAITLYGAPIPGFTRSDCILIDSDSTDHPVRWKGGKLDPAGEPIRLRFYLRQSSLYSFQIR